ncbi:nuclear transport factor 2 family protein [Solibacillus sp. CAU 1738]|uniref:nuclear transport factor 2 family protein n=1 Tax=Solibacillus sp. CAU 1738 TaxID=3140363 RepID=UPI003260391A
MKKWLIALMAVFVLAACSDKGEFDAEKAAKEIEKGTIGFEVLGGNIEEAQNVPVEVKEQLIAAFTEYVDAFNAEDIERYSATLSKNAKGFNYDQDLLEAQKVFNDYTITRDAEDITIVKYTDNEAHVFANIAVKMTEDATATELASNGRQVTVFTKEQDDWKVTSVYYIGNE